ncbi:MAG: CHAT domain-containing protein, partial [Vicinamibacterales bacterium]
ARNRDPQSALQASSLADSVQAQLAAGEAVVALNQLDEELFVWLVTQTMIDVVRRPLERPEAARLVARHRDEIDLEILRPRAGAALFNELVRPLGDRLKNVERLILVPDAPYYNVAFAALWDRDRDRYVIQDRSVSVLADVGALTNVKTAVAATQPQSAFVDVALPSTADAAFAAWSSAPERAVVRVAAPVRANNEYPGLSSVMFADAPGRRYSGLVLTREIATRDLSRLGVVILLDCQSASNREEGQGTLGAAAAFLAAGVPSVVATLWPIGESARSELFAGLDRELRLNNSAAAALRSLQRDVLMQNGGRLGAWTGLVAYGAGR